MFELKVVRIEFLNKHAARRDDDYSGLLTPAKLNVIRIDIGSVRLVSTLLGKQRDEVSSQ